MPYAREFTFHCLDCGRQFQRVCWSARSVMGKPATTPSDVRCPDCDAPPDRLSEKRPYRFRHASVRSSQRAAVYERISPTTGKKEFFYPARNDYPTPPAEKYGAGWQRREFESLRALETFESESGCRNEKVSWDNPDTNIEHSDPVDDDVSLDDVGGVVQSADELRDMLSNE